MKNLIEYYYNIHISEVRLVDDKYYFMYNESEYIFEKLDNIENQSKIKLILYLNSRYNLFHRIIMNKKHDYTTFDGNDHYVLMQINLKKDRIINLNDIMQCSLPISEKEDINKWKKLWEEKIDNFEYYINYIQDKREEDNEFYDYFIGMGEASINYLEYLNSKKKNYFDIQVISHIRITTKYTLYDLYNPLNLTIDHYTRDIAEYLKSSFFNNHKLNIENIITSLNLSEYASILLISRMLFPTFFFDIYELDESEKVLRTKKLIARMNEYEEFIYSIILEIKKGTNVPTIRWLRH